MKYILILLFALFAAPVFAQNQPAATDQLYAEIAKMDEKQREAVLTDIKSGDGQSSAARAREWVSIGEGVGAGLAASAERLGLVANDFAKTPVGIMAAALIIWHFAGASLIKIFLGCSLLFWAPLIWGYFFRKMFGMYTNEGKFVKLDIESIADEHGHVALLSLVALAIPSIIGVIVLVNA